MATWGLTKRGPREPAAWVNRRGQDSPGGLPRQVHRGLSDLDRSLEVGDHAAGEDDPGPGELAPQLAAARRELEGAQAGAPELRGPVRHQRAVRRAGDRILG